MGSPLFATLRVCFALDDGAFLTQTVFFGVFLQAEAALVDAGRMVAADIAVVPGLVADAGDSDFVLGITENEAKLVCILRNPVEGGRLAEFDVG